MTQHTTQLGIAFVVIGFIAMYLMFHLWGYPYDKEKRLSAAPRWAMLLHRILGYLFTAIYVALMWHMLPRIWEYQVEFPARTTAHIILGFTVGFLLLIKISIVRFFRHFEEWMPALGTGIMLGTVILLGLSLPFIFQEQALAKAAPGGSVFSTASRERVATLLPTAQLPATAPLAELSTTKALASGRRVLLGKCVKCHDLKTILAKPRTPSGWWQTVERMAEKPALFTAMSDRELLEVTAYLIAITPDMQQSAKVRMKAMKDQAERVAEVVEMPSDSADTADSTAAPPALDLSKAETLYKARCTQCHELDEVSGHGGDDEAGWAKIVKRMVEDEGAELGEDEARTIVRFLAATYKKSA